MKSLIHPGRILGRYQILEQIGVGGIGMVFRARDLKLHREVAVKILREGVSDPKARERFRNEALSLSRLNHPNIASVYDFDTCEGIDFLVMELVSGETFEHLQSSVPESRILDLGQQLAAALVAAHAAGIIHRDLKTANLRLTADQRLKVLDFGLAKLLNITASLSTATNSSPLSGTLPYMAPETLRGAPPDERVDIYGAGAVLYELSTGQPPYRTSDPIQLIRDISESQPVAPSRINPRISKKLEGVILKAMKRDPQQRYQSAQELLGALNAVDVGPLVLEPRKKRLHLPRTITGLVLVLLLGLAGWLMRSRLAAPRDQKIAMAVLPFQSITPSIENEHLRIGLADTITTRLSTFGKLRVRPTATTLKFVATQTDPLDAGKKLAADYVVTGTLQEGSEQIRVNVQLVRISDGTSVWGERYDLPRGDLLTLEDTISDRVVSALHLRVSDAERDRLYRRYTQDVEAYESYLRGSANLALYTEPSVKEAIANFEAALHRDPNYALAHSGLAMASALMRIRFAKETELEYWEERAREEANRALNLDPQLGEAHMALASVHRNTEFDWPKTLQESDRALQLNPGLEYPHYYRAAAFYHLGLLERVEPELQAAAEINPLNRTEILRTRGVAALLLGQFARADVLLSEARSPGTVSDYYVALARFNLGRKEDAISILRALRGSAEADSRGQAALASIFAAEGDAKEASALVRIVLSRSYRDHHVAYSLGATYAQLGDTPQAISWLKQASDSGFPCYPWFETDPLLAPLRRREEFRLLLNDLKARMESAQKQFPISVDR